MFPEESEGSSGVWSISESQGSEANDPVLGEGQATALVSVSTSVIMNASQNSLLSASNHELVDLPTSPLLLRPSPAPLPLFMSKDNERDSPTFNFVSENLAVLQAKELQVEVVGDAKKGNESRSDSKNSKKNTTLHLDEDWQGRKAGIRERSATLCNNELMADIHFVVRNVNALTMSSGPTTATSQAVVNIPSVRFPAHKLILATGSTVFYAMFYGSLPECGEEIVVPDVEPDAFLKMLRYLYADEIDLDEESVLPTLHVAKKYMIPHLARACISFMESSLNARNACVLLAQSRIFEEPELMQRCWEVIDAQAELALNSEGFIDIDHCTLTSILSRETLNCKEIHVFEAGIAWATAECERKEIVPTSQNLRNVLGNALQLIRVPTMNIKEFADGPAQMGIFSLEECHDFFLYFTASLKPTLFYPTTPRIGLEPQVCHRFQSSAYRSNQWRYRGRCDSIQFLVDRRVFILGFGLYGSSSGGALYRVHMELKRQGRNLAEHDTEFFSDGSSNTFHVFFDQPVQIDPEVFYTASVILDGMELSYFGQEGMTDVSVGPVSFQFQCSSESTNGTGVQGGQIPELIFYGPSSD